MDDSHSRSEDEGGEEEQEGGPNLTGLPPEIQQNIYSYLDTEDMVNMTEVDSTAYANIHALPGDPYGQGKAQAELAQAEAENEAAGQQAALDAFGDIENNPAFQAGVAANADADEQEGVDPAEWD